MKNLNLLLSLLLSMLLLSCSDDDKSSANSATNSGTLLINGVEKHLTQGFLVPNYDGPDPDYDQRRFYLILTNGNVSMQNNNFVYSDNITQLVDFNMYTSVQNPGSVQYTTYALLNSYTDANFNDALIDHSGINTNVMIQNGEYVSGESLSSDDMTSGQTTISNNNGIYTIDFAFTNAENTVTGTYTGTLVTLNYQY